MTVIKEKKSTLRNFYFEKNKLKLLASKFINYRTQDLPSTFRDAGQLYLADKKTWINKKKVFSAKTKVIELNGRKYIDIDNYKDLRKAKKFLNMEKYNHFKFVKKLFLKNLILVTGTHTSGKSMISPVIASFKKVEMLRKIDTLDRIAVLTNFGKIKKDISTYLAKNILDFSYYEQLIGRNLNFRHEDETGVSQSKNPNYFKKRIYVPRGPNVLKEHNKKNTHMLLDTHNGLWFYDFWNTLNIHNLKIISIFRNPIDVVNSWVNADFGITEKKILNQIPLIVHKKKIKAFYNYNFINHTKKNKNDVIVDMVGEAFLKDLTSYEKIKNKKKYLE